MLKHLQFKMKEAQAKKDELQMWLNNHSDHPDFLKIAADRNHLSVKINGLEFQISQLKKGLPQLGESFEFTGIRIEKQSTTSNKTNN